MSWLKALAGPPLAFESAALQSALGGDVASGFEELERRGLEGAMRAAVRGRLILLAGIISFTAWMVIGDPALWRRIVLGLVIVALTTLDLTSRREFRAHGVNLEVVRRNIAGMVVVQSTLIFATGGLASPALPVMLPAAFLAGLLADQWGVRRLTLGFQLPVLVCFGVLQSTAVIPSLVPIPFRGDGDPSLTRTLAAGVVMMVLTSVFAMLGARLRRDVRRNLEHVQRAQQVALDVHRQRADDLTIMSGEIAHELKNPLASVKGLTQLLSRSCPPENARTVERLGVLEREVVRMQGILDEFLNFSRPLSPLTRTSIDVTALCADLVSLHEGMSASLGVTVVADIEAGLAVDGDDRKIGQVLMNLLQNALEVSPQHSTVTLRGSSSQQGVVLEVCDEGPGLEGSVSSMVFEPGVTTKASGNGLGLTVARAIALQHGGALTLTSAPEGGCVARLTIPHRSQEAA